VPIDIPPRLVSIVDNDIDGALTQASLQMCVKLELTCQPFGRVAARLDMDIDVPPAHLVIQPGTKYAYLNARAKDCPRFVANGLLLLLAQAQR